MYCRKCGNKLEDDSAFCNYCGAQVITDKHSEEKEVIAEQEPVQEDVAKEVPSNTAKRSMKLPLIIGLGAAAVALVAGVVIFKPFGLFKTGTNDDGTIAESDIGETASETAISVGVDVLDYDGHSFACFFGCSTWEEARDQCEGMGGHLAVITSQEEDEALFAFTRYCGYDNVYIGYSDIEEEGNWQWVTGETSDYSNWNEGEPNGFTPNENYAVYGDNGAWYDGEFTPRIENGLISFICEWDYHVDGATNISSEELQTYIDGLDAVVTETEAAIETQVPSEEIRAAAYAGYLTVLESGESHIRDVENLPYIDVTCALTDLTGDGIEELIVLEGHDEYGSYYRAIPKVYSYNTSTNAVFTLLEIDGGFAAPLLVNGGGGCYLCMAVSNDGRLIVYDDWADEHDFCRYSVYCFEGDTMQLESTITRIEGPDYDNHPDNPYDYYACVCTRDNSDITESEFTSNESGILSSIDYLLQSSLSVHRDQMQDVMSSTGSIAMTYDQMHALLMSYT